MPEADAAPVAGGPPLIFQLFNEIGILAQLSSTLLNRRLPDGLHASHFGILSHLSKRDFPETPAMLADAFQVTRGTMTHSLKVLEARGFIALDPDPKDGRSKTVRLLPEGRGFREQAIAALAPAIMVLSDKLEAVDVEPVLEELRKLRVILDENRDV
ncbi:MAG: MarR family transcriptional regulator [Pseudomonadota bacterium]